MDLEPALTFPLEGDDFQRASLLPVDVVPYWGYCLDVVPILYTDPSGKIVPVIAAGVGIGAGVNLGVQLYQNDGDWDKVNWNQVIISGVAGGLGAGLGVGVSALIGSTTATNVLLIITLNGLGSGLIGGGAKLAENLLEGACDPMEGVMQAAAISTLTGMAGSAIGEGVSAVGTGIRSTKALNAQARFLDMPLESRVWITTLDRWLRNTFYLHNPPGTPYGSIPLSTLIGNSIGPGLSLGVSNMGPIIESINQP